MNHYRDIVAPGAEAAIWETALAIEAQAVDLVAVDKGELRNSISVVGPGKFLWIATGKREGFNTHGGERAPNSAKVKGVADDMTAVVGTASDHATANEFGRPDMPNYPAQPFLRPAALAVKQMKGQVTAEAFENAMKEYMVRYPFKKAGE
jgi:hypothetical protein